MELQRVLIQRKNRSREHKEIFRSALRFSFIERLLPNENKKSNLEKYYERLKKRVPWLIQDPHFWVQYAMAKIAAPDFEKAQQFLDNAYGKAKARYGYDTSSLDTQQARLYLLRAVKDDSTMLSLELFRDAHRLLRNTPNDVYKFRQLYLYIEYFKSKYKFLDEAGKKSFVYSCKEILHIIQNDLPGGVPQYSGVIAQIGDIVSSNEDSVLPAW